MIEYTCKYCGCIFLNYASDKSKYCTQECYRIDKTLSLEERTWGVAGDGYIRASGSGVSHHPMAIGNQIYEHWYVYYENAEDKEAVIRLKKMGCTIHHRDGNRRNNSLDNLEMWIKVRQQPTGISEQDAIHFLVNLGYTVTR